MLCRRRKTALVPLSLAALVKAVAASECILTCQDCLATAGCAHAMNDKYWDCMEDLPCLQEAAWNVYSQAEGAEQFDCDVACHGVESPPPPPPYELCNPSRISVEQSCWDNFAPCYLLWGVAVVYAIWSCQRVERVVREAKNGGEVGAASIARGRAVPGASARVPAVVLARVAAAARLTPCAHGRTHGGEMGVGVGGDQHEVDRRVAHRRRSRGVQGTGLETRARRRWGRGCSTPLR